jgi:hypothetical protein
VKWKKQHGNHPKMSLSIFLGNYRAQNFLDLQFYKAIGCNIFLKVHFFNSHLDFFPKNLWVAMSTDSDFIRKLPPRKSGSKASGFC